MSTITFREACCQRVGCAPETYGSRPGRVCPYQGGLFQARFYEERHSFACPYEQKVFWQCLSPRGRLPAKLLWWVRPSYFKGDLEVIRAVAACSTVEELRAEVKYQRYRKPISGFGRGILRVRISGQRLINFGAEIFQATCHPPKDAPQTHPVT